MESVRIRSFASRAAEETADALLLVLFLSEGAGDFFLEEEETLLDSSARPAAETSFLANLLPLGLLDLPVPAWNSCSN